MDCFNCYFFQLNEIIVDDYIYPDCQLPNIVLEKITFRVCPYCDARSPVIENRLDLHQTIAAELLNKNGKLNFKEIAFLLKLSGYHEVDIAPMMYCNVSTVIDWETGRAVMSELQEQFFRALMASKFKKSKRTFNRKYPPEFSQSVIILFLNKDREWEVKSHFCNRSNGYMSNHMNQVFAPGNTGPQGR